MLLEISGGVPKVIYSVQAPDSGKGPFTMTWHDENLSSSFDVPNSSRFIITVSRNMLSIRTPVCRPLPILMISQSDNPLPIWLQLTKQIKSSWHVGINLTLDSTIDLCRTVFEVGRTMPPVLQVVFTDLVANKRLSSGSFSNLNKAKAASD